MEQRLIDRNAADLKQIRKLYNSSFPGDERIPFTHLMNTLGKDRIMQAYYEYEALVGLTVVFLTDDVAYLSYICVEPALQDQGYGTEILKSVMDEYHDCRIVIDIEESYRDDPDKEDRLRRRAFYIRNGFETTEMYYVFYGVEYELLSWNGTISWEDWQKTIHKHWGKFAVFARKGKTE